MHRNKLITLFIVIALALGGLGAWAGRSALAQDTAGGWLGVAVRDTNAGVEIVDLAVDSPAEAAGLSAGMIISAVDDTAITSAAQLRDVLGGYAPETSVTLTVLEDDAERDIEVTLGARPAETTDVRPGRADPFGRGQVARLSLLGLDLALTPEGLRVEEIASSSPLAGIGLEVDDVITAINSEAAAELLRGNLLQTLRAQDPVVLTVQRGEETITLEVALSDLLGSGLGMVAPRMEVSTARPTQLGVSFRTLTPEIAAEEGLAVEEGALIVEVYEDTPAAAADLQAGDIVLAVADDVLDQERTLSDRLYAYEADDVVTLSVRRGAEELSLEVTLGPRNTDFGTGIISGLRSMPNMRGFRFNGPLGDMGPEEFLKSHPFLGEMFHILPDGTWQFHMPDVSVPDTPTEVLPAIPDTNA